MKTEYLEFTEEMVSEAGRLLAREQQRHRKRFPLLPARFQDSSMTVESVKTMWKKKYHQGYAAFHQGRMIAYLLGETIIQPWGRSGYVYLAGHALAENEDTETLEDLYTLLGEIWVQSGVFNHYIYTSTADTSLLGSLFRLGFGAERADALLDLQRLDIPGQKTPGGFKIRRAGQGDSELLGGFSGIISNALAAAPYWHPTVPEDYDELYEGWSELADDRDWTIWLAFDGEEALSMVGFQPKPESAEDLLISPRTVYLSVAATKQAARGRGISTALTWHGLEQARRAGFELCHTNWIGPNLLASRFWPRFGFQEVSFRLAKKVSPMIAWTRKS